MARKAGPDRPARQRHWRAGRRAEALAVLLLRLKGYRILARNWRAAGGEVDILARRGAVLAAVEVKRRADSQALAQAVEGLSRGQRHRVARAALAFRQHLLARAPAGGATAVPQLRFDLIVFGGIWPRHLPDAWRVDD